MIGCRIVIYSVIFVMELELVVMDTQTFGEIGARYGRFHPLVNHRRSKAVSQLALSGSKAVDPGLQPRHRAKNVFTSLVEQAAPENTQTPSPRLKSILKHHPRTDSKDAGTTPMYLTHAYYSPETSSELSTHLERMIQKLDSSISQSVRSLVIAVIVCFTCVMAAIFALIVAGIYKAYKTEEMFVDLERNHHGYR